jgi:hypothetical protein
VKPENKRKANELRAKLLKQKYLRRKKERELVAQRKDSAVSFLGKS